MKINVDLEELYTCDKCGVVFDRSKVIEEENYYICPVCKFKQYPQDTSQDLD